MFSSLSNVCMKVKGQPAAGQFPPPTDLKLAGGRGGRYVYPLNSVASSKKRIQSNLRQHTLDGTVVPASLSAPVTVLINYNER